MKTGTLILLGLGGVAVYFLMKSQQTRTPPPDGNNNNNNNNNNNQTWWQQGLQDIFTWLDQHQDGNTGG